MLNITRQNNFFFAWIDWSRAFNFRICFRKTLIPFHFEKTHTLSVAQMTVISRVKRLSSVVLCDWSSVFNFRIWLGKRKNVVKAEISNQKYVVKNSEPRLPFIENWEKSPDFGEKKTLIVSIFRLDLPFKI